MGETEGLICLIIYAVIFAAFMAAKRKASVEDEEEIETGFDSAYLAKEVEGLAKKMRELEQLDEMIIDLRLCKPAEVQRAFRMEWMSAAGKNHEFEFMADGENASTEYLLELATAEREELNAEILQRVYDLYMRACELDFRGSGEDE